MSKHTAHVLGFIVAITFATASSLCHAGAATARAGLAKATKAATAWKSDAKLTGVSTTVLKQDGTALVWTYNFLSPKTVNCARVIIVSGGEPRLQNLGKCNPPGLISSDFVDSPIMLKTAIAAGFKPDEDSTAILSFKHDLVAQDKACWEVHTFKDFDKATASMRGWCVDPKTGKFVVRLSGKTFQKMKN